MVVLFNNRNKIITHRIHVSEEIIRRLNSKTVIKVTNSKNINLNFLIQKECKKR